MTSSRHRRRRGTLSAHVSALVREAGLEVGSTLCFDNLSALEHATARCPTCSCSTCGARSGVPAEICWRSRSRHPRHVDVVIVASALDPAMMLEAMRAGVIEFVTEPLQAPELRAAIERVVGHHVARAAPGKVLAFIGAKGGVGTTTLAVNVATALGARARCCWWTCTSTGTVMRRCSWVSNRGFRWPTRSRTPSRLDASYLRSLVVRSKDGVDLLASPERPVLKPARSVRIARGCCQRLAELYPYVVLDVPRSDFGIVDALDPLTNITLVVNQELPPVRRAAQVGALLRQRYGKDRVGAAVTRYDARADIGQEDIERVVGLPVWATLPSDYRKVLAAANAGRPLVSDNHSRLAGSIVQLAERLAGAGCQGGSRRRPKPKTRGRLGFF